MSTSPLLPELPTVAADVTWEHYRSELRRCVNRGAVPMTEFLRLLDVSYGEQERTHRAHPISTLTIFRPSANAQPVLRGARIREAAVLVVRHSEGLSTLEVLRALERAGFSVLGARPLDVLRKALNSEVRGVMKRPPSLLRSDHTYTYIAESLSVRTLHRWNQRLPTLASGWRVRRAG
jgi:hypothetical protein